MTSEPIRDLLSKLHDDDAYTRLAALDALIALGPEAASAAPVVHEFLMQETIGCVFDRAVTFVTSINPDPNAKVEALYSLLDHERKWVRSTALQKLQALGPQAAPALPRICELIRTFVKEKWMGDAYARLLVGIGPAAYPFIREFAADPEERYRWLATRAIDELGTEAVHFLDLLLASVRDAPVPSDHSEWFILDELKKKAALPEEALEIIAECEKRQEKHREWTQTIDYDLNQLKSFNHFSREQASYSLAGMKERFDEIGPAMLEALVADYPDLESEDARKEHRHEILGDMKRLGPKIASIGPSLVQLITGQNEELSAMAAELLFSMAPEAPVGVAQALLPGLEREDAILRLGATVALGASGAAVLAAIPDAVERLDRATSDASRAVRRHATWALGQIGMQAEDAILPAIATAICESLRDDAAGVRLMAATMLGKMGARAAKVCPFVVAHAADALRDESLDVHQQAAESLGLMGAQAASALPALRESKRDLLLEIVITAEQAIDLIRDALHQRASS